jgi:hypothetical protein
MHDPREPHWQVAKHMLQYLKGTIDFGITYGQDENTTIMCYTDADWGNDQDDYKSIIGYVFKSIGGPITWALKKQKTIFLSSIDTETKAIAKGVKESIWFHILLGRIEGKQLDYIPLFCDNQNALKKTRNPTCHVNSKHVEIWHHYILEHVLLGEVDLFYNPTNDQIDDIMKKLLGKQRFQNIMMI